MIKARMKSGLGTDIAFLGLSGENVTRLVAGEPIKVNLSDLGMPAIEVVIHYGKTEQAIIDEFRAHGVNVQEMRDER